MQTEYDKRYIPLGFYDMIVTVYTDFKGNVAKAEISSDIRRPKCKELDCYCDAIENLILSMVLSGVDIIDHQILKAIHNTIETGLHFADREIYK